ncbi:hypothetical protein LCL96_18545 [Rossellomorea aquimaris]|uniref:hypothetical protein n=1 Tax=Rossellomorea aquimaris TaxID=189382 RepID=UPI001CD2DEA8|nr:hypothetical protein [Rossellomorea aquimaris]MCA1060919.1 hypothetical protein [Rossellomorea aquimaris]
MNTELLASLVGKMVKVNRGGPESRTGKVLYGGDDHFALLTEKEGVVYFNSSHVKSITQDLQSNVEEASEESMEFLKEDTLGALFTSLRNQQVIINRGGPEKLEGFLDNVNDDYVTLVLQDEVVRLATFHVKSISHNTNAKDEDSSESQESSNEQSSSQESNQEKSSSKKSKKRHRSALYLDEMEGAESGYSK